jgi:hyperosmotically inducible protein
MYMERVSRNAAAFVAVIVLAVPMLGQPPAETQAAMEKKVMALCVEKLGDDAKTIRATVTGDKAILTGQVTIRSVGELAEQVALSIQGIKDVDNQISIKNAQAFGKGKVKKEINDAKLESAAKIAISKEVGETFAKALELEATGGWVSLRGTLPDDTRKRLALEAVGKVDGVKKVVDLITVKP